MKRIGLWATGIGLISYVGVGTVELAYADEKERATTCSLVTVKGRYLFATSGTNFPPAATQHQLFARAGYRIFNGDGTGTIITTTSENGVIVLADSLSDLSYTVNKDCTGTYEVLRACPKITESTFERVKYGFTTEQSYHMLWW